MNVIDAPGDAPLLFQVISLRGERVEVTIDDDRGGHASLVTDTGEVRWTASGGTAGERRFRVRAARSVGGDAVALRVRELGRREDPYRTVVALLDVHVATGPRMAWGAACRGVVVVSHAPDGALAAAK